MNYRAILILLFFSQTALCAYGGNSTFQDSTIEKRAICKDSISFRIKLKIRLFGSVSSGNSQDGLYTLKGKMKRSVFNRNKVTYTEKIYYKSELHLKMTSKSLTGTQRLMEKSVSYCNDQSGKMIVFTKYPKNKKRGIKKTITIDSNGNKTITTEKFVGRATF